MKSKAGPVQAQGVPGDTVVIKPRIGDCRMGVWGPSGAEIFVPSSAPKSTLRVNHSSPKNVLSASSAGEALCLIKVQGRLHITLLLELKPRCLREQERFSASNSRTEVWKSLGIFLLILNHRDWIRMTLNHMTLGSRFWTVKLRNVLIRLKYESFIIFFYEMHLNMPCYKGKGRRCNFFYIASWRRGRA